MSRQGANKAAEQRLIETLQTARYLREDHNVDATVPNGQQDHILISLKDANLFLGLCREWT